MRRWTETTKWVDRWFRRLTPTSKIFYLYLLDNCDEAGVWDEDFELFTVYTGIDHAREVFLEDLGDRIQVLPGDKILVKKFLPYQQPKGLRMNVPLHQKIQARLDLHGLVYKSGAVTLSGVTPGGSGDPPPDPPGEGFVYVPVSVNVKKGKKKGESEGKEETLPDALDFPEFRKAWKEFKKYRSTEKKNKITKLGATRTLNLLAKNPDKAIEALELSMTHGYLGADPDWLNGNGSASRQPKEKNRNYENALDY